MNSISHTHKHINTISASTRSIINVLNIAKTNNMSLQELIDTTEIILVIDDDAVNRNKVVCLENVTKDETTMRGVVAAVDIPQGACWLERKTYSATKYIVDQFSGSELPMDSLIEEMMEPYENKTYVDFLTMFGYKDCKVSWNNVVSTSISNGAPLLSMLNHDINGNVNYYWYGHDFKDGHEPEIFRFCCTNRAIQKGEELTTSYFSLLDTEDVVRNRYYKDRKLAMEATAEQLLAIWDNVRDSTVKYMEKNSIFMQIQRDLIYTIDGKPCLVSEQDLKKEEGLELGLAMPSDFVGKFVIATICNNHYTLKKINYLLQIDFSRLFPCCETFVESRLKYMRRIFTLFERTFNHS